MNFGQIFLKIFLTILQTQILMFIGILLSIYKIITDDRLKAINKLQFYCILPIASFLGTIKALSVMKAGSILITTLNYVFTVGIAFMLLILATLLLKVDVRLRFTYVVAGCIASVLIITSVIADFSCKQGGLFYGWRDDLCAATSNGWSYAYGICGILNVSLWPISIPFIDIDKGYSIRFKTMLYNILRWYKNIEEFAKDKDIL